MSHKFQIKCCEMEMWLSEALASKQNGRHKMIKNPIGNSGHENVKIVDR